MTAPAGPRPRRVLVRLPNWLGDTVMAVPTLAALRAAWPGAEVWGVGPWGPVVLDGQGLVHRALPSPRGRLARLRQARELAGHGFDLAVILPASLETGLWAWVTGAARRIGYRGDGRAAFLTDALDPADGLVHEVSAYLGLLAPLGIAPPASPPAPRLVVSPELRGEARGLLAGVGAPADAWPVGIQLGAALGPSKLWSAPALAQLTRRLAEAGRQVVFLGAPPAATLFRTVAEELGQLPPSLVGRDRPALLPALLAELAALVSPDSGPAHVAAAVGTPVITLFGPTDPRRTGPLGPGARALWAKPPCAPCFRPRCPIDHRCLATLDPAEVAVAVLAAVAGPAR